MLSHRTEGVTVIIPAYNAGATIAECIAACRNQSVPPDEILVVDDGSTDLTASRAEQNGARVLHQENRGPAAARNYGAREATGGFLVFTDADCIPEPNWIESLLAEFAPGVAASGGTYTIANGRSWLARVIQAEIAVRHQRLSREVDFLGSFNLAVRRGAFGAVGGFDEAFRHASAEDNDLSHRLRDAGGALRFTRSARVAHYHPERLTPYLRTQARHGFWRMKLYQKHPHRPGDRYAPAFELAAIPVTLAAMGLAALLTMRAVWSGALLPPALVVAAAALLQAALGARLLPHLSPPDAARFWMVRLLRDAARGIGMIHGIWVFLILRRETVQ